MAEPGSELVSEAPAAAERPEWHRHLRGGYWNYGQGWWVPYNLGRLKSFHPKVGFGLIECDRTYGIYKCDVYIHKSAVPVPWNIGQTVEFAVHLNSQGQPQARDVMWIPLYLAPISPRLQAASKETVASATARKTERCLGLLKSYAPWRGYGFLTSEDIVRRHMCDVYLDRSQLPASGEWRIRQVVEFSVVHNVRGQPQARSVDWDPVPWLPDAASSSSAQKHPEQSHISNLNRVLACLSDGDKAGATRLALELGEASNSVDFQTFVLSRLGRPTQKCLEELSVSVAASLLLSITKQFVEHPGMASDRVAHALSWCEEIILWLKSSVDEAAGAQSFDNVMDIAKDSLSLVLTREGPSSEHAAQYMQVLGQFPSATPPR